MRQAQASGGSDGPSRDRECSAVRQAGPSKMTAPAFTERAVKWLQNSCGYGSLFFGCCTVQVDQEQGIRRDHQHSACVGGKG